MYHWKNVHTRAPNYTKIVTRTLLQLSSLNGKYFCDEVSQNMIAVTWFGNEIFGGNNKMERTQHHISDII